MFHWFGLWLVECSITSYYRKQCRFWWARYHWTIFNSSSLKMQMLLFYKCPWKYCLLWWLQGWFQEWFRCIFWKYVAFVVCVVQFYPVIVFSWHQPICMHFSVVNASPQSLPHVNMRMKYGQGSDFTKGLWSHTWNVVKAHFALILFQLSCHILHMPRQLSCRGMCKIVAWSDHYFFTSGQCVFFTRLWL